MRKNAFTLTIVSFVAGIFGFFLRWLQNLNGFDDAGLSIPGAAISVTVVVYTIAVLLLFFLLERFYLRKLSRSTAPSEAFALPSFLIKLILWAAAAFMLVGSLIYMFSSDFSRFPTMQRITGALGIFAGLCFPFICQRKNAFQEGGSAMATALIPLAFACFWLVTAYRIEAENPILWSYAPHILAIIAVLLAFYYVAAYFFGKAKPARCVFFLQSASYFGIFTLMDQLPAAETLMFIACSAASLVFQYVIINNAEKAANAAEG
ncbi:MAG: hypothetical protein E7420_03315 [Ruminococcaceae bacterium]|nr:hypothetical protein [Oscillospiraceae bacterium]